MLAEARMARGLSQTQLAELSGVAKQSISNYENEKQEPRPNSIKKLAVHLNIPLASLYSESNINESSPIYFRSLSSLTKTERTKASIKMNWLARLLKLYTDYLEITPPNLPVHLDVSNRYLTISNEEIEEIALKTRRHFNLGDGPISNLTILLENNGLIVVEMPLNTKAEDAFSRWVLDSNIPVAVMVSDHPSACRDRFSLAHELGHLIMHQSIQPTQTNLKTLEEQAHRFASSFLMPAHSYTREFSYPTLDVYRILKERWKTSIQAQIFRCKQLGIISDESAKRFYINIAKRKWKIKEPLDDIIPAEHPKLLREATKILCTEGGMTIEDISHVTLLSPDDIAQLTGMPIDFFTTENRIKPRLKEGSKRGKVVNFPPRH